MSPGFTPSRAAAAPFISSSLLSSGTTKPLSSIAIRHFSRFH
jgi:hypothetical protein